MATKQDLEEQLKQATDERDNALSELAALRENTPDRAALEQHASDIAEQIKGIDARVGELGQMSLKEGEKGQLRGYYAGTKGKLESDKTNILNKLNRGA